VVTVTAVAMIIGLAPVLWGKPRARVDGLPGRLVGIALAAMAFREWPLWGGHTLLQMQAAWNAQNWGWLAAVSMLVVSTVALGVEVVLTAGVGAVRAHAPVARAVTDAASAALGLTAALSTTGALIALAERPLGVIAIPLFLFPLVLTQFAVRRYSAIRETYGQTIRALSRLTEIGGYTEVGHAARVAKLSTAIGRDLGLSEREVLDLEYAALLHDIGQVSLTEPIPRGATVMAAPADQRRIAHDGAEIVRQTGVLDTVAQILEAQTTPYRQVREFDEVLPVASRIIKVANAYEDFAGERPGASRRESAMERINLGLGYEYDPAVVDSLARVLRRNG
jgi:hypothetical protein